MTVLQTYSPANLLNAPAALGTFLWNEHRQPASPGIPGGFCGYLVDKKRRSYCGKGGVVVGSWNIYH